jgi:hypothetical protein
MTVRLVLIGNRKNIHNSMIEIRIMATNMSNYLQKIAGMDVVLIFFFVELIYLYKYKHLSLTL